MSLVRWVRVPSGARAPEDLDALAGGERDDGTLGVLALAHLRAPAALALALAVDRVHAVDLHVEDLLHGDIDLRLVRRRRHDERVLPGVDQAVALLGDDRGEQDVPGVADAHAFSSVLASVVPSSVGACASGPALATSPRSAGALAASSAVAGAASSGVVAFLAGAFLAAAFFPGASVSSAAAFFAGAFLAATFLAAAFLAGASAAVVVSTVPSPSAGAID